MLTHGNLMFNSIFNIINQNVILKWQGFDMCIVNNVQGRDMWQLNICLCRHYICNYYWNSCT